MDLEAIKAKLAAMANQGSSKPRDLWKPKDKHVIRLLPYTHGPEPFIELGFHYDIGSTKSLLCPKFNSGDECAVCDFADKLRSWKGEDGQDKPEVERKADFEIFKKIQVKPRYYVAMIERDIDGGNVPKFWAFGKSIYETLLTMCADEEKNDAVDVKGAGVLTDTKKAFDLKIDFKKANNEDKKGNKKNFPITECENKLSPTPLAKTQKEIDEIISKIKNMNDVYPQTTSADVKKALLSFINSGGAEPEVGDVQKDEYKPNTAEHPVVGGQSLDEAFGALESD